MLNSTLERRLMTLIVLLPAVFLGLGIQNAEAQDQEGFTYETLRSPVMGLRGVVATSQPLASNAGLDILKAGGNAIDAAVATAAVLTLVEPNSTSIGGDAFIMIYIAEEDKLVGINASGRAPYSMTLDALNTKLDKHGMDRIDDIYSVSVPGAVDGWFEVL
jgi:gamma-glutamyltranspeptidase/glutathione hydrolase